MSQFRDEGARPAGLQLVFRRDPETGHPVEGRLRWGLIPHYADTRPAHQPIHARAETISEKRMFREAYRKRRCIVPMNSFFQKDSAGKRYAISRRDGAVFGVAGIWENWRDPLTSTWERTFAAITVPANALIAPIHDRMLAILSNEHFPRWPLSGGDRKALTKELGKARAMTRILAAQSAEMRAKGEALVQQADKLLCESWNERMWSDGEPIDPSPTIDQAVNGGFAWLEIRCARCKTPSDVDLAALKHPPTTFVHDLASRLWCRKCVRSGRRPSATLRQLGWQPRHARTEA